MTDWVQKQMARIHQAETGQKGGPGSGNWGHAGRPGLVGGSAAGSGGLSTIGAAAGSSHAERRTASDKYRAGRGGGVVTVGLKQEVSLRRLETLQRNINPVLKMGSA